MSDQDTYVKGELVPARGRYRCTGSGEVWEATETNVRFPPCDVCKDGSCRWRLAEMPDNGNAAR